MGFAGATNLVFGALEIGQHVGPAPADVSKLPPSVIVQRMAADIDHTVDRGAAAQDAAARIFQHPPVEARLRLGSVAPIRAWMVEVEEIPDRNMDPGMAVLAASLQQADPDRRIRRQPIGQHAARRARAHDHVVERTKLA